MISMPFDAPAGAPASPILPLTAESVTYATGGRTLVAGLTLAVEAGSRTVIMGPNGAGKSVTLRLLHGLLRPTAGRVRWAGRALDTAVRAAQAMVFQRPVLLRRSALANVEYGLAARGVGRRARRQRAEAMLAVANLTAVARSPARVLSAGEQQRLAMARALALAPQLLFVDEPTASLDPASTLAIERLVLEANAAGTTIVMVTHDAGQARRIADRVVFLHHGRVGEDAPAARFFDAPETAEARAFLAGRLVL